MEELIDTHVEAGSSVAARGVHRFKPRATVTAQLWLAASLWAIAAAILAFRGLGWVWDSPHTVWLLLLAVVLGSLKYRYILTPTAGRAIERIRSRGRERCAGGFLSWRTWLLVAAMMAGGHALRLTMIPRPVLGVLYVTIAVGLSMGAVAYARAALSCRC